MSEKIILKTEEDTALLGKRLADAMQPGQVYALIGDLGTGKTTLTKSIARALGITSHITSPTFTIVQEYEEGRLPLYHFDVYRVSDPDDLFEMGFDDYLNGKGVCIIEWADLLEPGMLPDNTTYIHLAYSKNENERICTIE